MADDTERRPRVRRSRTEDEREVVPLLFASGAEIYSRFAHSPEVVWVAEVDGRLAGAMAAFPARRARVARAASPPRAPQAAAVTMAASVAHL